MKSPRQAFIGRLRAWAARRHGADPLPHTVNRRRIYIVPTRFGAMLAALLVAMLVAGLNYGSNLALGFAFLMASLAIVAMHHCHRNLQGLVLNVEPAADGFATLSAPLNFAVENPAGFDRYDLEIHCGGAEPAVFALLHRSALHLSTRLPTPARGIQHLRQWELRTRYPFGWFRAWTYVHAPITVFVAPLPKGEQALPALSAKTGQSAQTQAAGDEEFAGLRPYQAGDALKHMAWKVIARGREPAVRHYLDPLANPEWLDWAALPGLDAEARLQQLCRWIMDADAAGRRYGLRLPAGAIEPETGRAHRRACLRALASFE